MQAARRTGWPFALCVVVAALAAYAAQSYLPVVRVAENWVRDLRVATLTRAQPQSERIVVVAITEDTLAAFPYRSPLDRRFVSELLRTLAAKDAKVIGLDVLLDQPSEPAKDAELSETLRTLPVPVVAAWADAADGLTARQAAFVSGYLDGIRTGVPMLLADNVDGTVRSVKLRRQDEGEDEGDEQAELGFVAAVLAAAGVDVPAGEVLTLRFRGAPDASTPPFPVYPAHAVALLPPAWIRDRIVLIGIDSILTDRHRTPFSVAAPGVRAEMPGVMLQAHALSQILEGRPEPRSPAWLTVLIIVSLALVGAGTVMLGLSLALKAVILACALLAVWAGGFVIFERSGELLPLVAPTLALVLAGAFTYAWRWREEHAQRRFVHDAFAKYVAPAIVDHMVEAPERLRLGGERRDLTFLFTDLADYTTLSETTEPAVLVRTMNEYLDGACEIILDHGGTIDKIVGDALHVMFNAPLEQPDHPERAVACALALDRFCQEFARRQRERGIALGVTRIGVNTGVAVVGNFGGEKRFDYTATGDAINTAARLESVNKHLGTRVCVSAGTVARCASVEFRPVGELVLKGKSEGVIVYEPIGERDDGRAAADEYLAAYRLMSAGDARASDAFRNVAARFPQDPLAGFHARRLAAGERGSRIVMKEK